MHESLGARLTRIELGEIWHQDEGLGDFLCARTCISAIVSATCVGYVVFMQGGAECGTRRQGGHGTAHHGQPAFPPETGATHVRASRRSKHPYPESKSNGHRGLVGGSYGLIHARYILTAKGLLAMRDKFEAGHFGRCPRVYCQVTTQHDKPGRESDNSYDRDHVSSRECSVHLRLASADVLCVLCRARRCCR
jgi:hypothetical protein